ncbi:MAG: hypothetical protein JXA66_00295 [Oligoflexia bacterium]|nr:hypothetical protein [Oligoflexia bacterium]
MRYFIITIVLLIALIYSIPTFVESYKEHKNFRASRLIAEDLLFARSNSIREKENYGLHFVTKGEQKYSVFVDINKNGNFDREDLVIKTVFMANIYKDVLFSGWFENKGVIFKNGTVVFNYEGKPDVDDGKNSVFLVNRADQEKGIKDRICRIYVDKEKNSINVLRAVYVSEDGQVVFSE